MGVSVHFNAVPVHSTKDFPFYRYVLENNTEVDSLFGIECFVWGDVNSELYFEWDKCKLSKEQITKEIEHQKVQMEKQMYDEEDYGSLEDAYINYMIEAGESQAYRYTCMR